MAFTTILIILIYIYIHNLQDPKSSPDSSHEKSQSQKSPSPVSVPVQNPISHYEKDARTLMKPDNHIILICSQLSVEQSFPEGIIKPYEGTSLMIG